jgi:hypothetical protein
MAVVSYILLAADDLARIYHQPERPTSTEARIKPSEMQEHRTSHRMLGPCCLCPMIDMSKPDFIESAIYIASNGEQAGQFVAACAKGKCGYFGES